MISAALDELIQHSHQITAQLHNTLQQIQSLYHDPRASPASLIHSIQALTQHLARFHHQLRASGLGALPANSEDLLLIPPQEQHHSLLTSPFLQRLEAHFQAIYHHRQIQRDAANIVHAALNSSSSAAAPAPADPSSSTSSTQKKITTTTLQEPI